MFSNTPKKVGKLLDKNVPHFQQDPGPFPGIGEQQYIEISVRQFSNQPDICS